MRLLWGRQSHRGSSHSPGTNWRLRWSSPSQGRALTLDTSLAIAILNSKLNTNIFVHNWLYCVESLNQKSQYAIWKVIYITFILKWKNIAIIYVWKILMNLLFNLYQYNRKQDGNFITLLIYINSLIKITFCDCF